jgi:DNA-binding response OmpR family regulator
LGAGCDAYIAKPINAGIISDSIAAILKEQQP